MSAPTPSSSGSSSRSKRPAPPPPPRRRKPAEESDGRGLEGESSTQFAPPAEMERRQNSTTASAAPTPSQSNLSREPTQAAIPGGAEQPLSARPTPRDENIAPSSQQGRSSPPARRLPPPPRSRPSSSGVSSLRSSVQNSSLALPPQRPPQSQPQRTPQSQPSPDSSRPPQPQQQEERVPVGQPAPTVRTSSPSSVPPTSDTGDRHPTGGQQGGGEDISLVDISRLDTAGVGVGAPPPASVSTLVATTPDRGYQSLPLSPDPTSFQCHSHAIPLPTSLTDTTPGSFHLHGSLSTALAPQSKYFSPQRTANTKDLLDLEALRYRRGNTAGLGLVADASRETPVSGCCDDVDNSYRLRQYEDVIRREDRDEESYFLASRLPAADSGSGGTYRRDSSLVEEFPSRNSMYYHQTGDEHEAALSAAMEVLSPPPGGVHRDSHRRQQLLGSRADPVFQHSDSERLYQDGGLADPLWERSTPKSYRRSPVRTHHYAQDAPSSSSSRSHPHYAVGRDEPSFQPGGRADSFDSKVLWVAPLTEDRLGTQLNAAQPGKLSPELVHVHTW